MLPNGFRALRPLTLLALLVLLPLAACYENSHDVTVPAEVTEATLSGRVLSWPGGEPVAGATVAMVQTGLTAVTDADGFFTVRGLRRGSYQYVVRADGLLATRGTAMIGEPTKAEDLHIHQNVYLMRPAGTATITVVDYDLGEPVEGARVHVTGCVFPTEARGQAIDDLPAVSTAVTGASGEAELTGLPLGEITITVDACDVDDDGTADLGSTGLMLTALPDVAHTATAVLGPALPPEELAVLTSTLPPGADSILAPSLAWVFTADMATDPVAWSAELVPGGHLKVVPEVELDGVWTSARRLELTPRQDLLEPRPYDLTLSVTSAAGEILQISRTFVWQTPATPGDCTGTVTGLTVPGAGSLDHDHGTFEPTWDALPGAGGYEIYARDDRHNPDWVLVEQNDSDYDSGTITQRVSLPPRFDRYSADRDRTPLAGTAVTLCVVPREAADPAPGGDHARITLTDQIAPTLARVFTAGSFDNSGGADPSPVNLQVEYSEYLAADAEPPVLQFQESGGDSTFVLDPADAAWTWLPGKRGGAFTMTVPAETDASGDLYRIVMEAATDQSGNVAADSLGTTWTAFGGGE
jgi:hypothetical protein